MPRALPRLHPLSRLQSHSSKGSSPGSGASWSQQKAWDQQGEPCIFCAHPSNIPGGCKGPAHCPLVMGTQPGKRLQPTQGTQAVALRGIWALWLQHFPPLFPPIHSRSLSHEKNGEGRSKNNKETEVKSIYEAWPLTLAQAFSAREHLQTLFLFLL